MLYIKILNEDKSLNKSNKDDSNLILTERNDRISFGSLLKSTGKGIGSIARGIGSGTSFMYNTYGKPFYKAAKPRIIDTVGQGLGMGYNAVVGTGKFLLNSLPKVPSTISKTYDFTKSITAPMFLSNKHSFSVLNNPAMKQAYGSPGAATLVPALALAYGGYKIGNNLFNTRTDLANYNNERATSDAQYELNKNKLINSVIEGRTPTTNERLSPSERLDLLKTLKDSNMINTSGYLALKDDLTSKYGDLE